MLGRRLSIGFLVGFLPFHIVAQSLTMKPLAQPEPTDICGYGFEIIKTAHAYHADAQVLDDGYSERVYQLIMEKLDPDNQYFTQDDYTIMRKWKHRFDDALLNIDCTSIDSLTQLYLQSVSAVKQSLMQLQWQDIAPYFTDSLAFSSDFQARSKYEREEYWKKYLVLLIHYNYMGMVNKTDSLSGPTDIERAQLFQETIENEVCRMDQLTQPLEKGEKYVHQIFLQSLAEAFDPHSAYFSGDHLDAFNTSLSDQQYSFGFSIQANMKGEIVISNVIPGSAAWNSKKIQIGDILQAVEIDNTFKKLNCLSDAEIQSILFSEKVRKAKLMIKNANGAVHEVSLMKSRIENESNEIHSFILKGSQKMAYIYLPSFYTGEDKENAAVGCAADLKKELLELNRQDIEGLILDLRDNGGGNIEQAEKIVGLFINSGNVGVIKKRSQTYILRDDERGKVYDGKMIVLINSYSASASEIVAAALQDYGRAIIVGSISFGKASSQEILPYNTSFYINHSSYNAEPSAYLKLTTGRIYRVNGKSLQQTGVIPDIALPYRYAVHKNTEKHLSYSLVADSLPSPYTYLTNHHLPLRYLAERSTERQDTSAFFSNEKEIAKQIIAYWKVANLDLSYPSFLKRYQKYGQLYQNQQEKNPIYQPFTVSLPNHVKQQYLGKYQSNRKKEMITKIERDPYLSESFIIMSDFIKEKSR